MKSSRARLSPSVPCRQWLAQGLAWLVLMAATASAHTNPSLTMEAMFSGSGSFTLRVNVDPRLFLSKQPETLPPVEATWYRDMDEAGQKKAQADTITYVQGTLTPLFDGKPFAWPKAKVYAIDGNSNLSLSPESKEVHLLVEADGIAPAEAKAFSVALARDATPSLVLLSSLAGKPSRYPAVLFAGETSRAFTIIATAPPPPVAKEPTRSETLTKGLNHFASHMPLGHIMLCLGIALVTRSFFKSLGILCLYHLLHLMACPLSESLGPMALRSGGWMSDMMLLVAGLALMAISQRGRSRQGLWVVGFMALWQGFYFMAPDEHNARDILLKNGGLALAHLAVVLIVWACRGLWRAAMPQGKPATAEDEPSEP